MPRVVVVSSLTRPTVPAGGLLSPAGRRTSRVAAPETDNCRPARARLLSCDRSLRLQNVRLGAHAPTVDCFQPKLDFVGQPVSSPPDVEVDTWSA